jgi:hypothetical protein
MHQKFGRKRTETEAEPAEGGASSSRPRQFPIFVRNDEAAAAAATTAAVEDEVIMRKGSFVIVIREEREMIKNESTTAKQPKNRRKCGKCALVVFFLFVFISFV